MPYPGTGGATSGSPIEYVSIGEFSSVAAQTVSDTGDTNKIKVSFGAGGSTNDGEFTLSSDGTLTCNKNSIQYEFDIVVRPSRPNNPGIAIPLFWAMYADDGVEANAVQVGDTFSVRIDDNETVWRIEFQRKFSPSIGSKLWFYFAADPAGNSPIALDADQPSGDLSGLNPVSTAFLGISKGVIS